MTPRSLFIVLIKLFGVYLIWEAFVVVFAMFPIIEQAARADNSEELYVILTMCVLTLGVLVWIIRTCLYRPELVIAKLSLDKGFAEETFVINPHRSTVLSIAIIVAGLMILVNSLPFLCQQFLVYVQEMNTRSADTKSYIALYGLKSLAGYLMVTNNQRIAAAIEQGRKSKSV